MLTIRTLALHHVHAIQGVPIQRRHILETPQHHRHQLLRTMQAMRMSIPRHQHRRHEPNYSRAIS